MKKYSNAGLLDLPGISDINQRKEREIMSNASKQERYERLRQSAEEKFKVVEELQRKGLVCLDGDFVPSVHYPPITEYPSVTQDFILGDYTVPEDGKIDVYVHIPFCARRCLFCHYPGKLGMQTEEKNKYLTYLEKEIDIYLQVLGLEKIKPRSILLGGGTPTYFTPEQLERFLKFLTKRLDLSSCAQFNVDLDPNSIMDADGMRRMEIMKEYGITRLTVGVQSLDDTVLKIMNRGHDSLTAIKSLERSMDMGFHVNAEFIYGHPGQTFENWVDVVDKAVTLPSHELQFYRLKVQAYGDLQGAIINNRKNTNAIPIPSFKDTMMMKQASYDILEENGFHENLRRVFSRQNKIFSHYAYNQCCNLYDQIGFGLTAFSSYRDRFALNTQSFEEYYAKIDQGMLPVNRGYKRNAEQQARWAIVLPMKNRDVRKADYKKITGFEFDDVFKKKTERLIRHGLIEDKGKTVTLTPLGKFLADEVVEQYNSNEFQPFPRSNFAEGELNPYLDNETEDAIGHV